jgi:hypothetical protein
MVTERSEQEDGMNAILEQKTLERLDLMNDEEWLAFMAYFAPKMLEEQRLLIEGLCRRAEQKAARFNLECEGKHLSCRHTPSDEIRPLLESCGLTLTTTP